MANPFSAYFSNALKTKFDQIIEAGIDFFKLPCLMYFPTSQTDPCPVCSQEVSSRSPNPYITPSVGQNKTTCTVCGGDGRIPRVVTQSINLAVALDSRKFIDIGGNVKDTSDMAQTICNVESGAHTSILKCDYIIFDTGTAEFKSERYERDGAPQVYKLGFEDFIITNWKKVK